MNLPTELRKWITAVIKQRGYLMKRGISRKNPVLMYENITYLTKHLGYYPFNTDRKIADLFQRNRSRILSLLPGEGSSGHEKRMNEFNRFDLITREVLRGCSPNQYVGIQSWSISDIGIESLKEFRPS